MTEPEYIYIKGEGWVTAPPVERYVRRIGRYDVTFEGRRPGLGEYYWSGKARMNADNVSRNSRWRETFSREPSPIEFNCFRANDVLYGFPYTVVSWTLAND